MHTIEIMESFGERLAILREDLGYKSARAFAMEIKIDPSYYNKVERNVHGLTPEKITEISTRFNINTDWLLKGDGYMYNTLFDDSMSDTKDLGAQIKKYVNKSGNEFIELGSGRLLMFTPLVSQRSAAGYLTGWGDPEFVAELPSHAIVVDKPVKGVYRSFEIEKNNESMNDGTEQAIKPGDIVTGRLINRSLWTSKLHLHRFPDYIIVHRDGITTKRISDHDVEHAIITCNSLNPDKETYPEFTIDLKDVHQIFNIVQVTKPRAQ